MPARHRPASPRTNTETPSAACAAPTSTYPSPPITRILRDKPPAAISDTRSGLIGRDWKATCRNIGYKVGFDWTRLESLYGSSKNYASKVNAEIDKLVNEKWLLPSDAKRLREELLSPKPGSR